MLKVGIYGASGRVGKLLCELVSENPAMELASIYFKGESELTSSPLFRGDVASFLASCDVAIDFTSPEGTEELLEAAEKHPTALVIGTTGLSSHQQNLLKDASASMPILYATNMSLGVALLNSLVETASAKLREFDIEIVEMHHRHKKDAPSGTALTLAESAARGRDLDLDAVRISGRDGNIGARTKDEIAVMDGGKCILQLRGVRPFFSDKYDITKHPNYKYLSDYDKKNTFDMEKHLRRRPALVKPDEVFDYYEISESDLQEDTDHE